MYIPISVTRRCIPALFTSIIGLLLLSPAAVLAEEDGSVVVIPPPIYGPVVDEDSGLLIPPPAAQHEEGITVARSAPRITFSTFGELPTLPDRQEYGGLWTIWGEGIRGSDGRYYVGIGDHRGIDAITYLYAYDPETHRHRKVMDIPSLVGQRRGDYGHGKLHGRMDEIDGWIYFASYWGGHPDHLSPEGKQKIGGHLFRYNVSTDTCETLGMPLPGDSFPMHATDVKRGIFHGVGIYGGYVAYDIHTRRAIYSDKLPDGISWDLRCTLVDPKTGISYGCDMKSRRIVGYDAAQNRFFLTKAEIPKHPYPENEKRPYIRCHTGRRLADESFVCQTYEGVMFKFWPDEQRTEYIGLNWGKGLYTSSMALSPDDRFVYYTVGAHGSTWEAGSPIIQMDTKTHRRKVLAFLYPYYQEKHGYVFGGSYSVLLDEKGEQLHITWNGRFRRTDETGESFGHPSFMHMEIPEAER